MRNIRTDLASELNEDAGALAGVRMQSEEIGGVSCTKVYIDSEEGAQKLGKPVGKYFTLEVGDVSLKNSVDLTAAAHSVANVMQEFVGAEGEKTALVVGLGNRKITPDSLGPRVLNNLQVTRHLTGEYGEDFLKKRDLPAISGIIPGVMAQTGMETAEILKGIIHQTRPQLLIVIDALAARSVRRLGTTIQLTDTGIHPGSGVGNHRHSLTRESLGVPVLAIGVPTVVGAAAIVHDTVSALIRVLADNDKTKGTGSWIEDMDSDQQYQLIRELLEPEFGPLYVTPPDIDQSVKQLSFTISEGIHQAVFP